MRWRGLVLCVLAALPVGCSSARLVYVDKEGGIVAIPNNSNRWPSYHRHDAEELIRRRCPNGYDIVKEEEVVTGQVAHTDSKTDVQEAPALVLGGVEGQSAERGKRASYTEQFGNVAVPLGQSQQVTRQTTSVSDVTEWRIYFRAK
jgi:hypothetical protein